MPVPPKTRTQHSCCEPESKPITWRLDLRFARVHIFYAHKPAQGFLAHRRSCHMPLPPTPQQHSCCEPDNRLMLWRLDLRKGACAHTLRTRPCSASQLGTAQHKDSSQGYTCHKPQLPVSHKKGSHHKERRHPTGKLPYQHMHSNTQAFMQKAENPAMQKSKAMRNNLTHVKHTFWMHVCTETNTTRPPLDPVPPTQHAQPNLTTCAPSCCIAQSRQLLSCDNSSLSPMPCSSDILKPCMVQTSGTFIKQDSELQQLERVATTVPAATDPPMRQAFKDNSTVKSPGLYKAC